MKSFTRIHSIAYTLRLVAIVLLFSATGDFMPQTWLESLFQRLGLTPMPHVPFVRHLLLGVGHLQIAIAVLFVAISRDVVRYRPLVITITVIILVGAPVIYLIDAVAEMPRWCGIMDFTLWLLLGGMLLAFYIWPAKGAPNKAKFSEPGDCVPVPVEDQQRPGR